MPNRLEAVFLGGDFLSLSLETLVTHPRVNLRAVFASPQPHHFRVRQLAARPRTALILDRLDLARHAALFDGIDLVLTAGYSHKMPAVGARYALNLHPSLLPACRGANPMPWVLFDHPEAAGVTLHVLAEIYDTGPVVASRAITGAETLSFESYCMLCNQAGSALIAAFLDDPERQYGAALQQTNRETPLLPPFPEHRRTISSDMGGREIVDLVRRIGPQGAILIADGVKIRVTGAEWVPASSAVLGKAFENNGLYSALACRDGFVLFKQGNLHRM